MTEFTNINADLKGAFESLAVTEDFDGDGDLDLLVSGVTKPLNPGSENYIEIESSESKIYINDGAGSFSEDTNADLPGVSFGSAASGDFDNDGDFDLLITGKDSNLEKIAKIYTNDGSGSFTEDTDNTLAAVEFSSAATADLDGDGDLDLLVTGRDDLNVRTAKIYTNDGSGGFTEDTENVLAGVDGGSITTADFDGDEDLDLMITGFSDNNGSRITRTYTNDGSGDFSEDADNNLTGVANDSVATGDFDGDGDLDLMVTELSGSKIYTNDGSGNFTEDTDANLVGVDDGSAVAGDFDGDEDLDLFIAGTDSSEQATSKIYTNDGSGNFTEDTEVSITGIEDGSVATGDFDGDRDLDLLIAGLASGNNPTSEIYRNEAMEEPVVDPVVDPIIDPVIDPVVDPEDSLGVDLEGDAGDNTLVGTINADTLSSGGGNDQIYGRDGRDTLTGGDGDDTIHGQSDNDVINGGAGNDIIYAGNGFDRLNGGDGNDWLEGRKGISVYTGGAGEDTFVFDDDSSVDWVRDFEPSMDTIALDGVSYGSLEFSGDVNTFIDSDGDRIGVLLDVNPSNIDASHFEEMMEIIS